MQWWPKRLTPMGRNRWPSIFWTQFSWQVRCASYYRAELPRCRTSIGGECNDRLWVDTESFPSKFHSRLAIVPKKLLLFLKSELLTILRHRQMHKILICRFSHSQFLFPCSQTWRTPPTARKYFSVSCLFKHILFAYKIQMIFRRGEGAYEYQISSQAVATWKA